MIVPCESLLVLHSMTGTKRPAADNNASVNEIFNPDRVDGIYNQSSPQRSAAIALDRGTNYGVVRLELLDHLYEKLYMQHLRTSDESQWPARILPNHHVVSASQSSDSTITLQLSSPEEKGSKPDQNLEVDYVFAATGYRRNAHEEMLSSLRSLLPEPRPESGKLPVSRDYRVGYDAGKVDASQAGIWLQGCNEETHGVSSHLLALLRLILTDGQLSDTLLSILAVRGGELAKSIFGGSEDVSSRF